MGEYARLYTMERFGVDIGDDNDDRPPKKPKVSAVTVVRASGARKRSTTTNVTLGIGHTRQLSKRIDHEH